MQSKEKFCNLISRTISRAATAALAIATVFALTVALTQSTQAQTYKVIHNFTGGADGSTPWAGLTMDQAGNLYGTATGGGLGDAGTVFMLSKKGSGWVFTPLYSFAGGNPPATGDDTASNFKLRCSSCHGVNGAGDASLGRTLKAADLLSPEVQKQSDVQLVQVISDGRKNMPSFSNSLTPNQIRALVAYIRKLAGKVQR